MLELMQNVLGAIPDRLMRIGFSAEQKKTDVSYDDYSRELKFYTQDRFQKDKCFYQLPNNAPEFEEVSNRDYHGGREILYKYPSRYEPQNPSVRERFLSHEENRDGYLFLWRHETDTPRPLVLCVHGFRMGHPKRAKSMFKVSDRFVMVNRPTHKSWPIYPGSLNQSMDIKDCLALRVHPGHLNKKQLGAFFQSGGPSSEKHLKLVAKALAEASSAHNLATYLLEYEHVDYLSVRYHAIEALKPYFGFSEGGKIQSSGIGVMVQLLDSFIARLYALADENTTLMITGGTDTQGYLMLFGKPVDPEGTIPFDVNFLDVASTLYYALGYKVEPPLLGIPVSHCIVRDGEEVVIEVEQEQDKDSERLLEQLMQDRAQYVNPASVKQAEAILGVSYQEDVNLGDWHLSKEHYRNALSYYRKALEHHKDDEVVMLKVVYVYLKMDLLEKAVNSISELRMAGHDSIESHLLEMELAGLSENREYILKQKNILSTKTMSVEQSRRYHQICSRFMDYE